MFLSINVKDHEIFKREGLDVHVDVPITFGQAALGATVRAPTLTGSFVLN